MRKMQTSTVQSHRDSAQIDRAIAAGEPVADIARRHGLTYWSILRRRRTLERDFREYINAIAGNTGGSYARH